MKRAAFRYVLIYFCFMLLITGNLLFNRGPSRAMVALILLGLELICMMIQIRRNLR
jgi:hypothetical protein